MPDGKEILNELEFEERLRGFDDRGLMEFTARQVYGISDTLRDHNERIGDLEGRDKKTFGFVGGIAGFIGTVVGAGITTLLNRLR